MYVRNFAALSNFQMLQSVRIAIFTGGVRTNDLYPKCALHHFTFYLQSQTACVL